MKVEGKSRYAISGCMLQPRLKERKFFKPLAEPGGKEREHAVATERLHFQLDNDTFVTGAPGYVFAIQILQQRNRILT